MKTETVTAAYRNNTATIVLCVIAGLTEGQAEKAAAFSATHYFVTGDLMALPKYQREALAAAGWAFVKIGHTTYESATWGAKKA